MLGVMSTLREVNAATQASPRLTLEERFGTVLTLETHHVMSTKPRRFPDDAATSEVRMTPRDDWPEDEDEFEQVWYIQAIQRWRVLILAGALLGGAAALVYATLRPLAYQGITTLLVVPPSQ